MRSGEIKKVIFTKRVIQAKEKIHDHKSQLKPSIKNVIIIYKKK
jgi:hypothetical protein